MDGCLMANWLLSLYQDFVAFLTLKELSDTRNNTEEKKAITDIYDLFFSQQHCKKTGLPTVICKTMHNW